MDTTTTTIKKLSKCTLGSIIKVGDRYGVVSYKGVYTKEYDVTFSDTIETKSFPPTQMIEYICSEHEAALAFAIVLSKRK